MDYYGKDTNLELHSGDKNIYVRAAVFKEMLNTCFYDLILQPMSALDFPDPPWSVQGRVGPAGCTIYSMDNVGWPRAGTDVCVRAVKWPV